MMHFEPSWENISGFHRKYGSLVSSTWEISPSTSWYTNLTNFIFVFVVELKIKKGRGWVYKLFFVNCQLVTLLRDETISSAKNLIKG